MSSNVGNTFPVEGKEDNIYEKFKVALHKHLSMSNDKIEEQLEAEEDMRHLCNLLSYDYDFDKETLIQLWLARGFIKEGEHKHEIGKLFFQILLSSGYVIRTGVCFASKKDKYRAKLVSRVKNDSARVTRDKLASNVHNTKEGARENEDVCLIGDDIDETSFKALRGYKDMKSLLLLCKNGYTLNKIPHDMFWRLQKLKVLHLSGAHISDLPSSIGNLTELMYLDLSHTLIELLPESIRSLLKLQTLKLNNCERLLRLPEAMRKLTSLEHLELDVLIQLTMMPKGMGALTKLRTLSAFIIHNDDGRRIKELMNMISLQGRFCLSNLENVLSSIEAEEAKLSEKFLEDLELRWSTDSHEDKCGHHDDDGVLEKLEPNTKLKHLKISCYSGEKFPDWICNPSYEMLVTIILFKCDNTKILPSLGQLPSLKFLSLMEMNNVKEIGSQFRRPSEMSGIVAFPKLERLEIISFPLLDIWNEANGDYPRLNELVIEQCPKLVKVPSSLVQLENLKHLEILHCKSLTSFLGIYLSTSLVTLIIDGCPLITKEFKKCKANKLGNIKHVQSVWINQEEIITIN
ncbi:putative disease resistance RPP13-like protein 1 [Bienertia sinuspersici]